MRSARAGLLAVVLVAVGAAGSLAAAPAPGQQHAQQPSYVYTGIEQGFRGNGRPTLQLLGDSIFVQAAPQLNRRLGRTHDVGIDAVIGIDTYLHAPKVRAAAARRPAVAVIELGTNDAHRIGRALAGPTPDQPLEPPQTVPQVLRRFDELAAAFDRKHTCLVFVTVNSHVRGWNTPAARAINAHLRHRFRHIADWDRVAKRKWFDAPDNPHPNATGSRALAALVDRTVTDSCGSRR